MADKIGGGGGFFDSIANRASDFIDDAADSVNDAAQTAADVVKSGADEVAEGAKEFVSDAADFGDEAIDVGKSGYDALREAGATAGKKVSDAKNSLVDGASKTADAFVNAMESASEFASNPGVRSKEIQEFLDTPFSDHIESGFESLGYSDEQVAVARDMVGHVVDGVGKALEAGDAQKLGEDLARFIDGASDDAKSFAGSAEEVARDALKDLDGFIKESVQYAETRRQDVVDELVDPAIREFAQGVGILSDLSSIAISAGAKALADTSTDLQNVMVSAPKKFESFLMAVTVNGIASDMVKGEEREIGLALKLSAHLEVGGKVGASLKTSIKCVDDDPLKYTLSMSRASKVGVGLGGEVGGKGASVDLVAGSREQLVLEFEPGGMSKALDLASRVASGELDGAEATRHILEDGAGLRLDSATGGFSVGIDGQGDIGVTEASVDVWKAAAEVGVGRTSTGELGARAKFSLSTGANIAAGLNSLGLDPSDSDGRLSDVVHGFGIEVGMDQLRQVEALVGGDVNLKGGWGLSGSMEITSPPDFTKAEFKGELVMGLDANDANLDAKVEISIANVGETFSKSEFDAFLKSSSELGALDLVMLADMGAKKGLALDDFVKVTTSVAFQREDNWKYGPDAANINGTNKLPPVTLFSANMVGNASPEVDFDKGIDDLNTFIEEQRKSDSKRHALRAQSAGRMAGVYRL